MSTVIGFSPLVAIGTPQRVVDAVPIDVSFVLFLMSVMTAVLALVVWDELSLREAAIYVAVSTSCR